MPHSIPNREMLSYRVETSRLRLAKAIDVIRQMNSASSAPPEKAPLQDALTELCDDLQGLSRDIEVIRDHLDFGATPRLHHFHVPFGGGQGERTCEIPFTD